MDDLSRLIESALEENHATLRKAAMGTVASMGPSASVRDLLQSDAAMGIRSLSIRELAQALDEARQPRRRRRIAAPVTSSPASSGGASASRGGDASERGDVFERIASVLASGPQTIGQLGRELDMETPDLRTFLQWMLKDGRLTRSGKARATRYHLA